MNKPNDNDLRLFGLILGNLLALGFGLVIPWIWEWNNTPNLYCIAVGLIVIIWALLSPTTMLGLYKVCMCIANCINYITNLILLAIVFYVLITPMGFIVRLFGKDPMCRTMDKRAASYRVQSRMTLKNHVERPY